MASALIHSSTGLGFADAPPSPPSQQRAAPSWSWRCASHFPSARRDQALQTAPRLAGSPLLPAYRF